MSHFEITNLFNAYDLQEDPYEDDKIDGQGVVHYCEARFRAALQTMVIASDEDLTWMTFLLFRELELCFSYIGVAAAIGRSIEIPIIVRSLGHDLYRFGLQPDTGFRPGTELLVYIDGNLSTYGLDDPNLLVEDFHLPWWKTRIRPKKVSHQCYLSFSNLETALAKHRTHLSNPNLTGSSQRPLDLCGELNKPAYSWHPEVNARLDNPCTRCRLYRAVSLGIVDKLREVENKVHGLEVANQGERDIGMRRASGFNALYETVLQKEVVLESGSGTGTGPSPRKGMRMGLGSENITTTKGKGKAKRVSTLVEKVRLQAEERWLNPAPQGTSEDPRSKWTWGVDLNSKDLWDMMRGADMQLVVPHSGYDEDLATGKLRTSSPIPSPNEINHDIDDRFDRLADDIPVIRHLRPEEFPIAFSLPMLHFRAACETDSGPELAVPSRSGSVNNDEKNANGVLKRQVMEREASSPDQPSSADCVSIISKGNPPHRPWLGPPPPNYVRPPTSNTGMIQTRVTPLPAINPAPNPQLVHGLGHGSDPEPERYSPPADLDRMDISDNGSDSDINMPLDSPETEDQLLGRNLRADESHIPFGDYGLVAPDSSEDDIPVRNYGLVAPNLEDNSYDRVAATHFGLVAPDPPDHIEEVGTFGLVVPDFLDDIEDDIEVENYALVAPHFENNSDDGIAAAHFGLVAPDPPDQIEEAEDFGLVEPDFLDDIEEESQVEFSGMDNTNMDSGRRTGLEYDSYGSDGRARTWSRIPLPIVNPATGQYTAESFANVPNNWFD